MSYPPLLTGSTLLTGFTVALTRPPPGNTELARLLRELGVEVLEVPLIAFGPPPQPELLQEAFARLAQFEWIVLTSPQAARVFVARVRPGGGLAAKRAYKLAAVGPQTAQILARAGHAADFVASGAGARDLGAQLPAGAGARALHLTSPLAEPALAQALAARHIHYQRVAAYDTQLLTLSDDQKCDLQRADVLVLASGSAVRALAQNVSVQQFPHKLLVVPGQQTAAAAHAAGLVEARGWRVQVAAGPQPEALAQAVVLGMAGEGV